MTGRLIGSVPAPAKDEPKRHGRVSPGVFGTERSWCRHADRAAARFARIWLQDGDTPIPAEHFFWRLDDMSGCYDYSYDNCNDYPYEECKPRRRHHKKRYDNCWDSYSYCS